MPAWTEVASLVITWVSGIAVSSILLSWVVFHRSTISLAGVGRQFPHPHGERFGMGRAGSKGCKRGSQKHPAKAGSGQAVHLFLPWKPSGSAVRKGFPGAIRDSIRPGSAAENVFRYSYARSGLNFKHRLNGASRRGAGRRQTAPAGRAGAGFEAKKKLRPGGAGCGHRGRRHAPCSGPASARRRCQPPAAGRRRPRR